jgi:hypothetical protein
MFKPQCFDYDTFSEELCVDNHLKNEEEEKLFCECFIERLEKFNHAMKVPDFCNEVLEMAESGGNLRSEVADMNNSAMAQFFFGLFDTMTPSQALKQTCKTNLTKVGTTYNAIGT